MPNPYLLVSAVVVVLVVLGGAGRLGYNYAAAECERARLAAEQENADALATLAARFQDAEQRYTAERNRKRQVVEHVVTKVEQKIVALPPRECPVRADARELLVEAFCAAERNSSNPECVQRTLPAGSVPAAPGGPGDGGSTVETVDR